MGVDITIEIPKEEAGRLLSSLTDIIRPFTEKRGLRADQIRLQREDVLLEIANKAIARANLESIALHPVPTKLLVPFLEKASLEDLDKDMQDRWAALLLSASQEYQARHLTFVDIMSRLSSEELTLLEEVCFSYKAFPTMTYPVGHFEDNHRTLGANASMLALAPGVDDYAGAYRDFFEASILAYGGIMHATVSGRPVKFFSGEYGGRFKSLELLQRERLVDLERLTPPVCDTTIAYFNVTYLGISFVRNCSPRASEMANRRH